MNFRGLVIAGLAVLWNVAVAETAATPKPPKPERIAIAELPMPPAVETNETGACTAAINPHRTGCLTTGPLSIQSGTFLPDDRHIIVQVTYTGAPAAPDAASVYSGPQVVLIKADGAKFASGDAWKCLTCGIPAENRRGMNKALDYPQAFRDGKRILAGTNILDCSPLLLTDEGCTATTMHIYPLHWNTRADGSGAGGPMRELRLHPDNVHLGFNSFTFANGVLGQNAYIGRLEFDGAPSTGEPLAPRYELTQVNGLYREGVGDVVTLDAAHPGELKLDYDAIGVGEFRGFSKDGREVFYIGPAWESSNIDVFAADLVTGKVRRLTSDPEYVDPLDASPDDKWIVVEDTRGSGRQMFLAAMRGVPPLTDLVTTSAVASVRNNRDRRFFQPYLIDRYGDRGSYNGQQINAGDGKPGSASDPNWNAMADPRWSWDGTRVAYWQAQVTGPACGGANPLPCPMPTEPDGRRFRVMIARFLDRRPQATKTVAVMPDSVPWGTPYVAGIPPHVRSLLPEGSYTLRGTVSGVAKVTIRRASNQRAIASVEVMYDNYSDSKGTVLNGTESVTESRTKPTTTSLLWRSNLTQSGETRGTKVTSSDGFRLTIDVMENILHAEGTLTTTINGRTYRQPGNGD